MAVALPGAARLGPAAHWREAALAAAPPSSPRGFAGFAGYSPSAVAPALIAICAARTLKRSEITRRRAAPRKGGFSNGPGNSAALSTRIASKDQKGLILEAGLRKLIDDGAPDIYEVRTFLTRLGQLTTRANENVRGDWMIEWASTEGCVDKVFGSGETIDNFWLKMREFLVRLSRGRDNETGAKTRVAEAWEVMTKVGPFPNQSNHLTGTFRTSGTTGLQLRFNKVVSDKENVVRLSNGEVVKSKTVDLDAIYSSATMLVLQSQEEGGECEFFVLVPVADIDKENERICGSDKTTLLK